MRGWVAFALFGMGCGRIGYELVDAGAPNDAHAIDAGAGDAGVDAASPGPCDPAAAFGTPIEIAELVSGADDAAMRLTRDELVAVFASTRSGSAALYLAERSDLASAFGAPMELASLDTASVQEDPTISDDRLGILFRSERVPRVGGTDIYLATRASAGVPFGSVMLVPNVNSAGGDVQPLLGIDGTGLYFASDRGGTYDLYAAAGSLGAGFAAAQPIAELNTADDDEAPVVSADGLTIYFASSRAPSSGGRDVWVAYRASSSTPFDPPTTVSELNSADNDGPSWVSPDGCRIYLTAHRSGADADLYVAERPPL